MKFMIHNYDMQEKLKKKKGKKVQHIYNSNKSGFLE